MFIFAGNHTQTENNKKFISTTFRRTTDLISGRLRNAAPTTTKGYVHSNEPNNHQDRPGSETVVTV
jgi:hypothetical protein